MPTKQRVRTNEERRPALAAQQSAGRGEEYPVRLLQPRPRDLAAQNRQLVSKHHDLKLLELTRAKTQRRNRKRATEQEIHKRDQQRCPPARSRTGSATLRPVPPQTPPGRIYAPDTVYSVFPRTAALERRSVFRTRLLKAIPRSRLTLE